MQFNLKLQMISKQHKKGVGFNQRPWRICRRFSHRCDKPYASGLSDCKSPLSCAKICLLLKDKRKIVTDSHTYDLSSDQFKGGCHTDGIQYIREFTYDGTICFTYEAGDITIKTHRTGTGKNLAAVAYEIQNKGEASKLLSRLL